MIKLLKNLGKKEWLLALVCLILIIGQVWLELKMPDYMSEITVLVQTEGSEMSEIVKNGGYMIGCAFGSLISAIIVGYIASGISATFSMKVRKKLFNKVGNLAMNEVKGFSTSSLITRTTNDITQIQMLVAMGLQLSIKAPITAVWAITKILNKSWQWSSLTAVGVVVLLSVIGILMAIVMPRFKIVQKLTDNLNRITRENLTGIRVIRAFNASDYQTDKFNDANNKLTNTQLFNQRVMGLMSPFMSLVMSSLTLGIYLVGAILIRDANLPDKLTIFSDMVVFSTYAMQIVMSFMMLVMIFLIYPRASVSAKRVNEVLDRTNKIKDGTKENGEYVGTVEFQNVSFKYPDADDYMIKNVSFKANKGETIAFIGGTGSGKSTLINLIPRFYDATEGKILVDGINVRDYKLKSLHDKIGYVAQKAFMFHGTVKENIAYGKENVDEKSLNDAIAVSQADFVSKMEKGVNSFIARGGTNVSGGQKQRLGVARAVYRNPEIYIFDDTFSALDYKTDHNLRKALKEYTKDATTLIVAQRIGTILEADKILVLDNGEVVGMGKHEELLKNCPVYKEIAKSQLGSEALK